MQLSQDNLGWIFHKEYSDSNTTVLYYNIV